MLRDSEPRSEEMTPMQYRADESTVPPEPALEHLQVAFPEFALSRGVSGRYLARAPGDLTGPVLAEGEDCTDLRDQLRRLRSGRTAAREVSGSG